MAKICIAAILALAPAIAFAQAPTGAASVPATAGAQSPPSAGGAYGPPAPTVEAHGTTRAAAPAPAASDDGQTPTRHRGHHRGGYAGTDAGIGR